MFDNYYILDGKDVKQASFEEYLDWLCHDPDRHVGNTDVGNFWVSTVFLTRNHQFHEGPPLFYETMVFSRDPTTGKVDFEELYMDRCSTYEEAVAMHEKAVAKTKRVYSGEGGWSDDE